MAVHDVSVAVAADYIFCPEPAARHALVDRFYRSQGYKVKIAASESVYAVYTATSQGLPVEMVAALRLVPQASGHFWLRNLLVAKDQRAGAVARVMMGLTLAMLIGNPVATYLGQLFGWRSAFVLVGAIALCTIALVWRFVPQRHDEVRSDPRKELQAFRLPQVWMALSIASIGFAGMFCVFSYLAPTMLHVTNVSPQWIPFGLAAFGVGGIIGNIAGGKLFDRLQFRAVGLVLIWSIAVLLFFTFAAHSLWTLLLGVGLVGTMIALAAPLQIRLMDIAHEAPSLAAASNHAAFNLANALGPWFGGMAITAGFGWTSTGYIGAATALVGLGLYLIARRMKGGH